jgi:hypothetical protein
MPGPAAICNGARRAVLCFLALPVFVIFAVVAWLIRSESSHLPLLLPGVIALPIYALVPNVGGKAVLLSNPTEEAKSASRGLTMIGVMLIGLALSGVALFAWHLGWFWWFLLGETIFAIVIYIRLRTSLEAARWPPVE